MGDVTQSEIARRLGISQRAVGYALSDSPQYRGKLRPETRRKVIEVADRLGYRPHRYAQLMRGKKSGVIGVIKTTSMMQTTVERSFFVAQAIQAAGYGLVVNEIHWDEIGVRRATDVMVDARVEGVVLAGLSDWSEAARAELQRLRAARIPMVAVGGVPAPAIPFVTTDYRQGLAALTRHVLQLGHRTLALVSAIAPAATHPPHLWVVAERLAGFREAAEAAGLGPSQARVLHEPLREGWTNSYAPGQAAVRELVNRGERPDVLLCSNDEMAVAAMATCTEAGWSVPEDIAVTGFDNTMAGRYVCPPLTTVAQPTEAVARKGVELLLRQIRGETLLDSEMLVKLPCQVVVRQSCGASLALRAAGIPASTIRKHKPGEVEGTNEALASSAMEARR